MTIINGKEYRLVPVEPTSNMVQASWMKAGMTTPDANGMRRSIRIAWHAMLDAAPAPETAEAAQDALEAARYRWLRNYEVDSYLACGSKEKLDAAIDAAIAAGGEE